MGQLTKNEVFALAVQRYSDAVYRAAVHNCRCTADAEDVVQDVFEKLLHYEGCFESEEHLKAWLLRVAINRCHDLTRAAHQKDTELDENLPAPDAFEDGSVLVTFYGRNNHEPYEEEYVVVKAILQYRWSENAGGFELVNYALVMDNDIDVVCSDSDFLEKMPVTVKQDEK